MRDEVKGVAVGRTEGGLTMQRWEYKVLQRTRKVNDAIVLNMGVTEWDVDVLQLLPQLGREGWELVAVSTLADKPYHHSAGVTTSESWVFKRPIEYDLHAKLPPTS